MPERESAQTGIGRWVAELKRRRVPRVAAAYLIVGWAVVEVADTTFPYLGLPDRAVTLIIALVALGLPVALVLAWAFQVTPEGVRRDDAEGTDAGVPRSPWPLVAVLGSALVIGGLALWHRPDVDVSDAPLHPGTAAVLPFRVAGASPELAHLREGLIDLLSITLSGEVGPKAVDSRAVLSAWEQVAGEGRPREEAVEEVGRRLGAARLVLGEVVGRPERLTVSATLLDTATGEERARARVEGPLDSLPALVDQLTARLISLETGEERHRLRALSSTSMPALMEYLEGRRDYRAARYTDALAHFRGALEQDTTFALAGLGAITTAGWIVDPGLGSLERVRALAWHHRDRLSERDRAYLAGLLGPEYPAPSSFRSRIEAWERAAQASPGRPEVWFHLGDSYFHRGASTGATDWANRARAAFQRALALDSTWNTPLRHLVDLAFLQDHDPELVRLADLYLDRDTAGVYADYARYQRAQALADTAAARRIIDRMIDDRESRSTIAFTSAMWGDDRLVAPEEGSRALARMLEDAATTAELREIQMLRHDHALNRGWPDTALAALDALGRLDPGDEGHSPLRMALTDAIYWDGDVAHAEAAASRLEAATRRRPASDDALDAWRQDLCALGQWWATVGRADDAREAGRRLRQLRLESDVAGFRVRSGLWRDEVCATLLDALASEADGYREDVADFTDLLDKLLLEGPPIGDVRRQATLALVRLLEQLGRTEDAATATDRWDRSVGGVAYRTTFAWERGRLMESLGETGEAIRALRAYTALRRAADPPLREGLERARARLAALAGEG